MHITLPKSDDSLLVLVLQAAIIYEKIYTKGISIPVQIGLSTMQQQGL